MNQQRRTLLKLLTLAVAAPTTALALVVPIKFAATPFQLGVASGSPTADGFVLWTRLSAPELNAVPAVRVLWQVFDLDKPNQILAHGEYAALAELAHSVHVEVDGLAADRWYGYQFQVAGYESDQGRTRTLPSRTATPTRLRFAYASCQGWESGFYAAYRHMLGERLDLIVFVGDYIYEGPPSKKPDAVRTHSLRSVRNLADYRARYALYKSDPDLQRIHAHCPWLVTWDDHEVQNNYAGSFSMYETKAFNKRRAAAYQAYYEHMPLRTSTLRAGLRGLKDGAELRIYDRVDFGTLAAFHVLDDRQYRDAPLCPNDPKPGVAAVCMAPEASRSILGEKQEAWLGQSFLRSVKQGVRWNVIVQQTRFTPANYRYGPGRKMSIDNWDGYPQARQRLLDSMQRSRLRNPVIVGGDIHQNWVARVHHDPYDVKSPLLASEFCGTSISSTSSRTQAQANRLMATNPHCLLDNPVKRGYGVVEITPAKMLVKLRVLDNALDVDSGVATLAQFEVADGKFVGRAEAAE
ncbi:alkaline phosphatase [Pusillimonas sp. ANT_WB101]|uniref:alkaline phosphatase D family protein n=1 Tax=Pusillimonas sp. ANT_WB101 TaxID=2597356 RepID=UPI0011EEB7CD|nr:alkaline phosphatase D family protein [Pusillimonas sp. ANT_WB101]KAA0911369.1 alkaline phosphatase [Pusillimonas sp. ANT_WB101]